MGRTPANVCKYVTTKLLAESVGKGGLGGNDFPPAPLKNGEKYVKGWFEEAAND